MKSINLQILKSAIFSQDANPSLISHTSIVILEEQHFVSCWRFDWTLPSKWLVSMYQLSLRDKSLNIVDHLIMHVWIFYFKNTKHWYAKNKNNYVYSQYFIKQLSMFNFIER